jgi:hypothetical protein
MNNRLQFPRRLDTLIESTFLGNILYDSEIEFRGRHIGMSGFDGVSFLLRTHRGDHGVAVLEENVEDMGGDEARSTFDGMLACAFGRGTERLQGKKKMQKNS